VAYRSVGRMTRVRLDTLLADRGLFGSRSRAAASVMAGEVLVGRDRRRIDKPGQMVEADVEVSVDAAAFASEDSAAAAWNYDFLRTEILRMTEGRRFNLQETLAREIYELIAARQGVTGLRVSTRKPDIYPDCAGVGVEISSF